MGWVCYKGCCQPFPPLFTPHSPVTEVALAAEETQDVRSLRGGDVSDSYHGTDADHLPTGLHSLTGCTVARVHRYMPEVTNMTPH